MDPALVQASFSQLAYVDFQGYIYREKTPTIRQLVREGAVEGAGIKSSTNEFIYTKDVYEGLVHVLDHSLISHQPNTPTGFAAAAFQSPEGQIIFAFRGTEPTLPSSPIKAIHAFLIRRLVSIHTLAV